MKPTQYRRTVCVKTFYRLIYCLFYCLFTIVYVREMISNDLGANNFNDDLDTTTRKVLLPFWVFKKYNPYQFSVLTDDLQIEQTLQDFSNMVVSFNQRYNDFAYASKVLEREKELLKQQGAEGVSV